MKFQDTEKLYRILFEQSPYGVIIADLETAAIIEFNDAFCTQLGYTRDEFAGMCVFDFEAAETPEETKRHIAEIERQGGDEFITKHRTKQGEIRDYMVLGKPIELSGKKFLLSIHRDITERMRIERAVKEERDKAQKYLDIAEVMLVVIDIEQKVTLINRKGCEILGYKESEIIGKNWFDNFIPQRNRTDVKAAFNKIIAREIGTAKYFVNPVLTRDDEERIISWNNTIITDEQGKIMGTLSSGEDITERERWEEELKLRSQLLDSATDSIYIRDSEGSFIYVNEAACKFLGYSREELMKMKLWQIVAPEYIERAKEQSRMISEKNHVIFESAHLRKDGSIVPVEVHGQVIEYKGKKLRMTISRDITERKRAEQALKENEERYRLLVEISPDAIFVQSEGRIVFMNSAGAKLFGADSPDQLVGKPLMSLVHPDYHQIVIERTRKTMKEGTIVPTMEEKYLRLDGTAVDVEVKAVPFIYHGKFSFQVIVRDITERKKMEEALASEAIRRRILIEQSRDGIVVLDQNGKVYEANKQFAEMLGYSPEEVRDLYVWDWEFQYPREQVQEMVRSVDETGDYLETRHRRKDGTIYDVAISTNGAVFAGQKLIFCVCREITERKHAEEELKLRAQLLDNANDSIFLHDFEGNFVYINETMCKSHGYSREELMNMKLPALIIPEYTRLLGQQYQDLIEKGHNKFESAHFHKDGSIIPMEIHSRLIELENRKFILTVARDITERKKFENAIKQLAYHDPLTGLPNRILFKDHVTLALAHAARYNNKLALMVVDLDKFKEINDTLGHDAGDQLLRDVGNRLLSTVRKTDTVSRMGGDEFVLLISEIINEEDAANVAQKILETIRKPFMFKRHKLNITPSIGIAVYPKDGKNINTLTKHADFAMYRVKQGRQNGYLRYMPNMSIKVSGKRSSSFKKPQTQKPKP